MKNMKLCLFTFFIFSLALFSCGKEESSVEINHDLLPIVTVEDCSPHEISDCNEGENSINIRVRNFSRFDICNIEYTPYIEIINFGSIKPGDSTCYISESIAYKYPNRINFYLDDTVFTRNAVDFVGENILENGNYNYNIYMFQDDRIAIGSNTLNKEELEIPFPNNTLNDCAENTLPDCGINQDKVNIRVINHSIFDLCNITYQSNDNNVINFGNLLSGEISCYVSIESIYEDYYHVYGELSNISLIKNNLIDNPILDEQIFEGNYTLHIAISKLNENGLSLRLTKDS